MRAARTEDVVSVTYYCPYCEALTSVERDAYLADKCVTPEPLEGWEYAATTEDYENADGIEFVCLGDADGTAGSASGSDASALDRSDERRDGCGRTFYLSYVKFREGREVDPRVPRYDGPSFQFRR